MKKKISESDKRSKQAFKITKNVTESCAETILDVRSGGIVGELQAENKILRDWLVEERLYNFQTVTAKNREKIRLHKEIDIALKENKDERR